MKIENNKKISQIRSSNNLRLEIENILAFLFSAGKFWDRRMRMIVWATFKRQIKVFLFTRTTLDYVKKHRKGSCTGCGSCCQFIRRCPYLNRENACSINGEKHLICRVYPISNSDVALVLKTYNKKCGYYFD